MQKHIGETYERSIKCETLQRLCELFCETCHCKLCIECMKCKSDHPHSTIDIQKSAPIMKQECLKLAAEVNKLKILDSEAMSDFSLKDFSLTEITTSSIKSFENLFQSFSKQLLEMKNSFIIEILRLSSEIHSINSKMQTTHQRKLDWKQNLETIKKIKLSQLDLKNSIPISIVSPV